MSDTRKALADLVEAAENINNPLRIRQTLDDFKALEAALTAARSDLVAAKDQRIKELEEELRTTRAQAEAREEKVFRSGFDQGWMEGRSFEPGRKFPEITDLWAEFKAERAKEGEGSGRG